VGYRDEVNAGAATMSGRIPAGGAHGGDVEAVAQALGVDPAGILDLSVSLNPDAPDVAALAKAHLDALTRYPDTRAATEALAAALAVPPERVLLTNGGSEAIALVCQDLGRAAVDVPCEFSLYARHLAVVDPAGPRIRSNPHNPTGVLAGFGDEAAVWDEAFYPLAAGRWTRGDRGVTVVGSLTKVFGCPGLRAGYVLGDPDLVDRLASRQPQWALNGLAAGLIPDLLAAADLPAWAAATAERRAAVTAALPGVERSDANYVLVRTPAGAAAARAALARHGVLVRDCSSFGLPGHIRVGVPDEAGLRRLVEAWERAGL
jgi:histidinol-phosphate/aromatic aminotransferase/cobyric acid decarboxylase-like protein